MVWNIIIPLVARYARIVTFPVAVVLGGLGYYIERRLRGIPHTPVPHEKSIIDERTERQKYQDTIASPYQMESVIPRTIFEKNNPENLRNRS